MDHGKIVIYDAYPIDVERPGIGQEDLENPTLFTLNVVRNLRVRTDVDFFQEVINRNSDETQRFEKDLVDLKARLDGENPYPVVQKFGDGETDIQIPLSVRDADVYIFQHYIPPLGEREKELNYMVDACSQRGRANRVVAVMPYCFGQRGERQTRPRQPVPAQIIARNLANSGAEHCLTICEHNEVLSTIYSGESMGYENLTFELLVANYMINHASEREGAVVIATPDLGATTRAGVIQGVIRQYSDLENRIVIANKDRYAKDKTRVVDIIGDVKGSHLYIADDIGSTMGSMLEAVKAYKQQGAVGFSIILGHPVLAEGYQSRLDALCEMEEVDAIVFGNTLPLKKHALSHPKVKIMPCEPFFAEAIHRLNKGRSISSLHKYEKIVQVYEESPYPKGKKYIRIKS